MATKQSANYDLTLQDNDEFIEIETTAENFRKLDEIIKGLEDEIDSNSEKITDLNNNGYSHPTYTSRTSGLYKITVDSTGHVKAASKVTKSDITALGVPSVNTVYTHPSYTSRTSGLYKITVDSSGHVSGVSKVTKDDITALGIPGSTSDYTHPKYTARGQALYKVGVDSTGHVDIATQVTKDDIVDLGIPGTNTTYVEATTSEAGLMSAADKIKVNKIDSLNADVAALKESNGVGSEVLTAKNINSNFDSASSSYYINNLDKYKIVLVKDATTVTKRPILACVTGNGTYYILSGGFSYFWDADSDGTLEEHKVSYFARIRYSDGMVITSQYCEDGGTVYGLNLQIIGLF